MRFDKFVEKRGLAVSPVNRFAGFIVEVGVPPGWEPFDSAPGLRVWAWRDDPCIEKFCANAVLTMHRVEAPLNPADVFTMLAEQQLQSVPGCRELRRALGPAGESAGVHGYLALRITYELGAIDSASQTRIITAEQETLIAQLTVTAQHDSPANQAHIRLTVRPGATAAPAAAGGYRGFAPATGTRGDR
jgi:hypothetical protein